MFINSIRCVGWIRVRIIIPVSYTHLDVYKRQAYWLDPGQRRFRDEGKAFGWVGFRVAQDAKSNGKGRTKR